VARRIHPRRQRLSMITSCGRLQHHAERHHEDRGHAAALRTAGRCRARAYVCRHARLRRVTAAAISPTGRACSRCSLPIRRTADLQSVTVAVAHRDVEEFRVVVRVNCARWPLTPPPSMPWPPVSTGRSSCAFASAYRLRKRGSLCGSDQSALRVPDQCRRSWSRRCSR
jgi:hypothetical protein